MRFIASVFLVFAFYACSKEENKPDPTARDISGTVQVSDEFGVVTNDVIGVTVTLSDGTRQFSTQTFQGGKYIFDQVPFGKYFLAVSRTGYGTNKRFGIQNQKTIDSANYPLQLNQIGISQMCTTTITSYSAKGTPNGAFDFWVAISPATGLGTTPRYFRIFVGKDSLIDWENADVITPAWYLTGSGQSGNIRGALPPQYYPAGTKAWIRVYGDAGSNNMYYDSLLNKFVFPCMNLNTQPAASLIVQ